MVLIGFESLAERSAVVYGEDDLSGVGIGNLEQVGKIIKEIVGSGVDNDLCLFGSSIVFAHFKIYF